MIIDYSQLIDIRKQNANKKIVLGGGTFDLIHYGHVQYLQQLKEHGEILVVAVKSDVEAAHEKGVSRPIIPEIDRARMVNAIKDISYVFIVPKFKFVETIKKYRPDCFMTTNSRWEALKPLNLTKVVIEPRISHGHYKSTTAIIQHIKEADFDIPSR